MSVRSTRLQTPNSVWPIAFHCDSYIGVNTLVEIIAVCFPSRLLFKVSSFGFSKRLKHPTA